MRRPRRKVVLALVAGTAALAVAGVGAYAEAGTTPGSATNKLTQLADRQQTHAISGTLGLDPALAVKLFTLRNGQSVSVLRGASGECLIRGTAGRGAETCGTVDAIDAGEEISVFDECGTSGANLMEIMGLAPTGVPTARLVWSDGAHEDTAVTQGVYNFEGTNPASSAPYPVGVVWIDANGAAGGEAVFPVEGNNFCLPAG